jgi:DNA repair protein RadC
MNYTPSKRSASLLRERAIRDLSDEELVAVAVSIPLPQATAVLEACGGLASVDSLTPSTSQSIEGVGGATVNALHAAAEIGRRCASRCAPEALIVTGPRVVAMHLMEAMRYLDQEETRVVLLDGRNKVTKIRTMYRGTANACLNHPRDIFRFAIENKAVALILVHNHPSGDPTPSSEDLATTKRMSDAGELVGIKLLDHLIIGDGRFTSLAEQGLC